MSTVEVRKTLPPECDRARETFALALADGLDVPAAARAHAERCNDGCAKAFARIERVWGVAGDTLPRIRPIPQARLDAVATRALDAARAPAITNEVAKILPLRRERAPARHQFSAFAAAVALAAMVATVAILGPALMPPPVTKVAVAPTPAPVRPPRVTLTAAKGQVSLVPADGSVFKSPAAGDLLPPGLFSASQGAALSIEGAGLLAVRGDTTVLIGGAAGAPDLAVARGEIFVDLPKGTIQTFIVHTPTGSVNVTGTQFGVKVAPTKTEVEVTRGTVIVKSPNGEQAVGAGEAAKIGGDSAPALITGSDPATDPLAWVRDLAPDRVPPRPVVAIRTTGTPTPLGAAGSTPVAHLPGLAKEVVEMAMDKRGDAMRRCYELELVRDPALVVRAALQFRVDEDGRAKDLIVTGVPATHPALGTCLVEAAASAIFPAAAPGTEIDVTYPVHFVPAK